ncbi:MAG: TetR/AcrR family transcriptional regulator [Caulobacterales bacterium]
MDEKTATRDRILQAASERIKHYGYAKTTMAEIAADTGMSPGNIYRFFEAKIDIAEAMARRHYEAENNRLGAIARDKSLSVKDRLYKLYHTRMRDSVKHAQENAKIVDIADVLYRERPTFAAEQQALERIFLTSIIEEGIAGGVFAPGDATALAETMQLAMVRFTSPQIFLKSPLPKLERELEGVIRLIINGLRAP